MFTVIARNAQKKMKEKVESLVPLKRNFRLAVLGASGPTGLLFLQQALDKGHEVIALVRCPEKVNRKVKHVNLMVTKVNIFKPDHLAEYLSSYVPDAVVSCLGSEFKFFSEITLYSDSMKALCMAMRKAKLTRVICISAWFVEDKSDHPWLAKLFKPFFHRYLDDMYRMEQYLKKAQDIEYTSVRSPEQTDGPMLSQEPFVIPDVDYSPALNPKISKADLAKTMLKIAEETQYPRQCVIVGMPLTPT